MNYPFRHVLLDWSVRVDDLISCLTFDEIINQLACDGCWDHTVHCTTGYQTVLLGKTEYLRGQVNENSTGFLQVINLATT
ncbi:unnamed protein product [Didymodactylos carnosus]|uniref:Uncharacterized protein n=1 Tax=Didymodactylos carnosus TaxID=1234261 RepID=A0A813ZAZ7_9BILA|nr:unnamed protein product [Didymodactylos carnosus]CAF0896884.1 unnamed protein product [Didymodactylos carnosus]CAF3534074.1 unnamed protein product [Didymodactylos carnosus]CAF3680048.1 unnamed protein product [Didymodactylos carnosus]